jgi:hypothetical protein
MARTTRRPWSSPETACEVAAERAVDVLLGAFESGPMAQLIKSYQRKYTFVEDKNLQLSGRSLATPRQVV